MTRRYGCSVAIQRLRLVVPPTLLELLEDETYERYFSRLPLLYGDPGPTPWRLMARRHENDQRSSWAIKDYAGYGDARRRALRLVGSGQYRDVSVVSRRTFFRPPLDFRWDDRRWSWCGRCRRPTRFREMRGHPALRGAAVVDHDLISRCYYCGIRETMMPHYAPRLRSKR